jgi:hypothetical protein
MSGAARLEGRQGQEGLELVKLSEGLQAQIVLGQALAAQLCGA